MDYIIQKLISNLEIAYEFKIIFWNPKVFFGFDYRLHKLRRYFQIQKRLSDYIIKKLITHLKKNVLHNP